jgi:hypothetical protein
MTHKEHNQHSSSYPQCRHDVENALAQLLEAEGYATRVLKTFLMGEALVEEEEMPVGGVDLVVLALSLSTSECEAFLAARRRTNPHRITTHSSPIPAIVHCTLIREAPALLEEEEQAVRSVPWPTSRERLVREMDPSTDPQSTLPTELPPPLELTHSEPF